MSWIARILTMAACAGCVRSIPVERPELPALATYGERGEAVLVKDNEVLVIGKRHRPELIVKLNRDCSAWQHLRERCDRELRAELDRVRIEGTTLRLDVRTSRFLHRYRPISADLAEVRSARLEVADPLDGWRPHGAVGLAIAGPLGIMGISGHWYPVDWLALDLGVLPAADLGAAYAGARIRPFRLRRLLPFAGTFLHGGGAVDPATGRSERWSATGARVGLDLELGADRRWLVSLEADLVRPLDDDRTWVGDLRGTWLGWAGGLVGYQF